MALVPNSNTPTVASAISYERRERVLRGLRNKYRNVTARVDKLNRGEALANTDEEFAVLIGRHLDAITARAGWTDTDRWITQATNHHAAQGLPGLLQLITSITHAL